MNKTFVWPLGRTWPTVAAAIESNGRRRGGRGTRSDYGLWTAAATASSSCYKCFTSFSALRCCCCSGLLFAAVAHCCWCWLARQFPETIQFKATAAATVSAKKRSPILCSQSATLRTWPINRASFECSKCCMFDFCATCIYFMIL